MKLCRSKHQQPEQPSGDEEENAFNLFQHLIIQLFHNETRLGPVALCVKKIAKKTDGVVQGLFIAYPIGTVQVRGRTRPSLLREVYSP